MTQQNLIELIKVHFPGISNTMIREHLNTVSKDFCRKTRILKAGFTGTTEQDQRWYALDSKIIEVESVTINTEVILKLVGRPNTEDIT